MKSVIIGTAGHIDHGKTALVKALTGIDADRLEEEKRRGITIDLGFAHLELGIPGDLGAPFTRNQGSEASHAPIRLASGAEQSQKREEVAGGLERSDKIGMAFIDVPGHERFVRNMLAGVGGIDLVLLVVAADESIKPQTREHFEICRLLSIPRGITVITKADLVDEETLNVVRMEIEDFVRGSFLDASRSPVVAVSSLKGAGLEELKREIAHMALQVPPRDSDAIFRLPIDRVFVMKGFGTVVTGTLIAGQASKEQEVAVYPPALRARVRGIQVHGAQAPSALAGQRTALNLAGVQTEELARGMMLTAPETLEPVSRIDVEISLLRSAPVLKSRSRVHLHAYSAETIAEITLHEAAELKPGSSGLAQLTSSEPLLVVPGDRLILRQFSPVVTIAGARVLDAFPLHRQRKQARVAFLRSLISGDARQALLARIQRREHQGLTLAQAVRESGLKPAVLQPMIQQLAEQKEIVRAGDLLIGREAFARSRAKMRAELEAFHKSNPLVAGISKEELREKLGLSQTAMEAVLAHLIAEKQAEAAVEQVKLAGRGVALKDDEARAKEQIEKAFAGAGLKVPLMKDVLAALPVDKARAQKLVTLLLRDRVLVKLSDDLVFHQSALHELRTLMAQQKAKSPKIDVARFKDLIGVTRKYAIPLLEYLDRERVTRRVGDERIIL